MNKRQRSQGGRAPATQAQAPQSSEASSLLEREGYAAGTPNAGGTSEKEGQDRALKPGDSACKPANATPVPGAAFDEARFTAGVVKLYEALLKEPVPADMLRLVEQLGKQERK